MERAQENSLEILTRNNVGQTVSTEASAEKLSVGHQMANRRSPPAFCDMTPDQLSSSVLHKAKQNSKLS
ncbi:hypothetical protein Y1Q_0016332 [Alligator mississippiensis]|uniref:Uncharacterized protein n=1 Tax=Alligator mississippiensis TaxID=8496 RepID=A0A151N2D9_ALLMI|nr:hypothetical protein Y1Q_0016332 [Alligator mississippiensis]